jgi:hypothetical protein
MINELEGMWIEAVVAQFKAISRHLSQDTMKTLVKLVGFLGKIRNGVLQNTNQKRLSLG